MPTYGTCRVSGDMIIASEGESVWVALWPGGTGAGAGADDDDDDDDDDVGALGGNGSAPGV